MSNLANEIEIAGFLRIDGGRLLAPEEKRSIVAALRNVFTADDIRRAETDGYNKGVRDMAQGCPVCREAALH